MVLQANCSTTSDILLLIPVFSVYNSDCRYLLVSTYVVCERLSVMHKQVSVH